MSNEASYSFTTKIGGGNDLFTVRGDTYDEFLANLTNVYTVPAVKLLVNIITGAEVEEQSVAIAANVLGGTVTAAPAFNSAMPASAPSVSTQVITSSAATSGRVCSHGQMTAKQGVGKDGKVWRGYMCPAPAGATDKCKNQYIYPNQPEWHTFVAA